MLYLHLIEVMVVLVVQLNNFMITLEKKLKNKIWYYSDSHSVHIRKGKIVGIMLHEHGTKYLIEDYLTKELEELHFLYVDNTKEKLIESLNNLK